jgi:hypothetical protein
MLAVLELARAMVEMRERLLLGLEAIEREAECFLEIASSQHQGFLPRRHRFKSCRPDQRVKFDHFKTAMFHCRRAETQIVQTLDPGAQKDTGEGASIYIEDKIAQQHLS